MIVLRNLTKIYTVQGSRKVVAWNLNTTFPTGASVAILGSNGTGKSTLLRLVAGTAHPTWGEVLSTGSVSFPVGLATSLHRDLTGAQNTRFVARIYGVDTDELIDYVQGFADLGAHFHLPVRSYSSGMRARLSFGINMGLNFDTYLIDEVTAVGDASFKKKSRDIFLERMQHSGALFVSHSMSMIREMCEAGAVMKDGQLEYFDDVEDAIKRYMETLETPGIAVDAGAEIRGRDAYGFPNGATLLYCFGAAQGAVGWLHDVLSQSPDCHFGPVRAAHYFDIISGQNEQILGKRIKRLKQLADNAVRKTGEDRSAAFDLVRKLGNQMTMLATRKDGFDRYRAYIEFLLTGWRQQTLIGDFTEEYARLETDGYTDMAQLGSARFLMILRDPASLLWQMICDRIPKSKRSADACRAAADAYLKAASPGDLSDFPDCDMIRTMEALEQAVRSDRREYLFHEWLFDPARVRALCEKLGVTLPEDAGFAPPPANPLPPPDERLCRALREHVAPQYHAIHARLGGALPQVWLDAMAQLETPAPHSERAGT